jgi:histone H3/H4
MLVARLQVKEIMNEEGLENISHDYMERLNEKVKQLIIDSVNRAKENGRRTIMGRDV